MMVTELEVNPLTVKNGLESFLNDNNFSRMQFDILRFIERHPRTRFSYFVIAVAVGTGGAGMGEALVEFINKDIISTEIDENGLSTYGLSGDISKSIHIYAMADLDWSEAGMLRKQLIEDTPVYDPLRTFLPKSTCDRHIA